MNEPIFIFAFGVVVTAIIMTPLGYAIVLKNRINDEEEEEKRRRRADSSSTS